MLSSLQKVGEQLKLALKIIKLTWLLEVKDTGKGIPTDQIPYIFDRFHQLEDSITQQEGGTGIGLSLVAELIQLMNGEIKVESELGQGTSFTILLPVKREAPILEKDIRRVKVIGKAEVSQEPSTIGTPALLYS